MDAAVEIQYFRSDIADNRNNHHRNQGGDQRIFDGGTAPAISKECGHNRVHSIGISGMSAGGIG